MTSRLVLGLLGPVMIAAACSSDSDTSISTRVKSRLIADDTVKAREIDVDTEKRVVTLSGDVWSIEEEARALQIARETEGVTQVVDRINVGSGEPGASATTGEAKEISPDDATPGPVESVDSSITEEIQSKLLADPQLSGLQIDVTTADKVVMLGGAVPSESAKARAIEIAATTEYVKSVEDRLRVQR